MSAYWNQANNSGWFSYGFSGSRVDAVIEIPPQYLTLYEAHTGKHSFGEAFTGSVDENASIMNYMWGMLDYPLYFQLNNVFCKGEEWGGVKWVFDQDGKYKDASHLFTFLDNHDRSRFLANASDNWAKLRMALAFQYAARGIPVIYYGTEQNMAGNFQYSEETLNYYNREMMTGFSEDTTTFHFIQRLNELRKTYGDVLINGVQNELYYSYGDPVYAFSRRNEGNGREILCVFNNSASAQTKTITLNAGKTSYVAVDGGMPDNPRFALYEASYKVRNVTRAAEEGTRLYTIAGRCCESGDLIQKNVSLPETKRGDFIAVETTGAYNYSMASNYNRLPRPAVIMLDKNEEHIVVRRETFGDILDNDL